ncbi:hypothetical protein Tco_1409067 [Tanacetum coccineum]
MGVWVGRGGRGRRPREGNASTVTAWVIWQRIVEEYRGMSACPRLNRAKGPEENRPNQVAANNWGQGRGNQGNQARGRAFILGAKEARQDPNIVTACASLESKNEVCLLCEVSPKANPSLQIHLCFFGEQSQPLKILGKGEKVWEDIQVVPGFVGREMRLLGKIQKLRGNYRDRLDSYSFGNLAEFAAVTA